MLEKYLQDIGLSDKEASIYTALLQYENANVSELAKKTKVNRTTIYSILESLAKKGLVSKINVDKKETYQAEPPERLETFVERQKITLEEQAKRLQDIIPQLKSIQRETGEKPVVKYFEGKEGIISSFADFYSKQSEDNTIYNIYPYDLIKDAFSAEESERLRSSRLARKIKSKVVYTFATGEKASTDDGIRIKIDEKKYPILCDISVYSDKVKISTLGKTLSCISIESRDLAETIKSIINLIHDCKK